MSDNDELVSQFMAFTGSADPSQAASYIEMSGGNLETAVGLYMEHQGGGGGGPGGAAGGGGMDDQVRAPDATRSMRLMDDFGGGGGGMMMGGGMMHGGNPYGMHMDPMLDEQLQRSAFADDPPAVADVREAINRSAAALEDNQDEESKDEMDDEDYVEADDDEEPEPTRPAANSAARLADMFAPPDHLIYKEGGFEGARTMAKDSKRWLLVNLQRDSEFSCHALNRDVWRDELVENLVREGFILWQTMDVTPEGRTYAERYKVYDYPHIGIIDPRTRRLMWKKEGWTQEKPMTAELFAEIAMDFCSRHSLDKPPVAPRPPGAAAAAAKKRPMHEMSEDEQLQAAMRASLQGDSLGGNKEIEIDDDSDEDDGGDIQVVDSVNASGDGDSKPAAAASAEANKKSSLMTELLSMQLPDEPDSGGARIQFRMPSGKRQVRKFSISDTVKQIYAFVSQSDDDAKGGKEFVLMAGFPPKDLISDIDNSIESCQLAGEAITVRWK